VPLRHKDPLKAVLSFLVQIVNMQSPLFENHLASWFTANGLQLTTALVLALADTADQVFLSAACVFSFCVMCV